jgi:hypothetical protein
MFGTTTLESKWESIMNKKTVIMLIFFVVGEVWL